MILGRLSALSLGELASGVSSFAHTAVVFRRSRRGDATLVVTERGLDQATSATVGTASPVLQLTHSKPRERHHVHIPPAGLTLDVPEADS